MEQAELLGRAVVALERIADLLAQAVVEPVAPPATGCTHPAETRIDFGLTGGVEDWQCRLCGYRTVPPVEG